MMPDKGAAGPPGHKFMALRQTTKNGKGRYVTGAQVCGWGLDWGKTGFPPTRDDLALIIGRKILDEAGV
ncbi:MAG TPA: hypothetical protein PKL24_10595 [Polyangiaceae bacterium]|nr:hypothetical protein [Polyangiaceae bacterium]HOH00253.1 hypothetical protein [Polyangiaceae bacterium]HOR35545.1 hypothetical protein [Polyangiaceae bacterium]HPK93581.1 hypothetical protein [Polyangiaceae bacterium]HQM08526.1 hypothetical protein [Polyangiaceae bacterium]